MGWDGEAKGALRLSDGPVWRLQASLWHHSALLLFIGSPAVARRGGIWYLQAPLV